MVGSIGMSSTCNVQSTKNHHAGVFEGTKFPYEYPTFSNTLGLPGFVKKVVRASIPLQKPGIDYATWIG